MRQTSWALPRSSDHARIDTRWWWRAISGNAARTFKGQGWAVPPAPVPLHLRGCMRPLLMLLLLLIVMRDGRGSP